MSVILDALRRSRGEHRPAPSGQGSRQVPAGLGLTPPPSPVKPARVRRWLLVALPLILLVALWGGWRFMAPGPGAPQPDQALAPPAPQALPLDAAAAEPATAPAVEDPPSAIVPSEPLPRTARRRPRAANTDEAVPVQAPTPAAREPVPQAATQGPEAPVNHFELALRYQRLGDLERARAHYLAVLAADEFHVEARNNLGLLYHALGRGDDAVSELRRAVLINPSYIRARSNLAVVLTSLGRLAEARAELRGAIQAEPRNVDLLVNMALVEKADRRPEQAMEWLIRAVGVEPAHPAAHYNLAVLYEERASLALAYDHFTEFLEHAGPEHGALLTEVRNRILQIEPRLHARAEP